MDAPPHAANTSHGLLYCLVGVGVQVVVHLAGAGDGQLAEPVQGPGQVVAAGAGDQVGLAAVDAVEQSADPHQRRAHRNA